MSDDEEMSDLSQVATQSGSIACTSMSLSNQEAETEPTEPWGEINIFKITRRRLGLRGNMTHYSKQQLRVYELVQEKTTFGRNGDCDISKDIDENKIHEISNIHFSINKKDVNDPLCPVFVEDSSTNGTFFRHMKNNQEMKGFTNYARIDEKIKRRIMAHKDVIFIEKWPTICFEFHSLQMNSNNLPDDLNKEYHIGKILGQGACGVVYFAQNRKTCQPFALKYTDSEKDENTVQTILKEVSILTRLKHPSILQLFQVKTYTDSVAILIDFMQGGDLLSRIQSSKYLSENLTKFIFYQICCGVEYLHSQNVTHRDLKPENILLATTDRYTMVKVSDFGLSKCVTNNTVLQTQCGTRGYLAPEVKTAKYTNKVDIWSLGVILYNCFTGCYPFNYTQNHDNRNYKLCLHQDIWNDISNEGRNIVHETLNLNADERPSANALLTQRNWLSRDDTIVQRANDIINNPTNKLK